MPNDEPVHPISRHHAQSGRVSFGDPVILHESTRTRVAFIPFFIPRTEGTELACKIQTYRKATPPHDWLLVDEKSLSLKEEAARVLLISLSQHLAVAEHTEDDGRYLVIPVDAGVPNFGDHDPSAVANALCRALGHEEIIEHLHGANFADELHLALRGAIRLREMQAAVTRLRTLLEEGEAAEQSYQTWCEQNSWAFGSAYVMRDEVREISPGDSLDLLLPTVIAGYRDIAELKRPDVAVLNFDSAHRNYYFSADVSKAIGQCHRYLDVLHEVAANGLRDHPEIVAYHPRAILVIGRSNEWEENQLKALHGLNSRLSGITVMTYDHLLNQGERLIQTLSEAAQTQDEPDDEFEPWSAPDDEGYPF